MNVHRLASGVVVRAPAKVNLFFEVLGKRSDGFHEVETLMVPINLFDLLVATLDPSGTVRTECRWALTNVGAEDVLGQLPPERENIATKAVGLLRSRADVDYGIRLELAKHIPTAAGLGGGSSDAAAALLAANALWELDWSRERLAELAADIGSDVPFFLYGRAAICRGRGEQVEPVESIGQLHLVVVRPPEGLSTADVYGRCRPATAARHGEPLAKALCEGDMPRAACLVHNHLQSAAEAISPWIGRLKAEFARQDCWAAQMSGSGSSYFGICRHARHARRVAGRLRARGLGYVFAASTCN